MAKSQAAKERANARRREKREQSRNGATAVAEAPGVEDEKASNTPAKTTPAVVEQAEAIAKAASTEATPEKRNAKAAPLTIKVRTVAFEAPCPHCHEPLFADEAKTSTQFVLGEDRLADPAVVKNGFRCDACGGRVGLPDAIKRDPYNGRAK